MYNDIERSTLLGIARESVRYGLKHGKPLPLTLDDYSKTLQEHRATFITLKIHHDLRGCIGTLAAYRPLVEDVANNAFAAAFRDPRFSPLTGGEFSLLHYHISVLNPPEPFPIDNEAELFTKLQPGKDGLVLEDGFYRSTFLPSVWESLPTPEQFVQHLKLKAGLPANYWSDGIRFQRYSVEDIE
jgi:AmmeMemoRadiSam system protein A